jgi:hypothetical protein
MVGRNGTHDCSLTSNLNAHSSHDHAKKIIESFRLRSRALSRAVYAGRNSDILASAGSEAAIDLCLHISVCTSFERFLERYPGGPERDWSTFQPDRLGFASRPLRC